MSGTLLLWWTAQKIGVKPQLYDTPQGPAWLSCQDDKPGFTAALAAASLPDQPALQAARALALLGHNRFPTYSRLLLSSTTCTGPPHGNSFAPDALTCPLSLWDCLVLKAVPYLLHQQPYC